MPPASDIPSSTTDMTSTTSSATDVPSAAFIYPTSLLTLNNIDVVQVGYRTVWNSVNLTVFCEMGENTNEFSLARINKIQSNGTYAIAPIQAGMQIPQFPTYCNFMLCNAENSNDYTTGAGFTMVSTQGIATTYALAATRTATAHSSASNTSKSPTTTARNTESALAGAASSPAAETALSSVHSSGLSGGAKAGIAIGVLLGIAALIAAAIFFFRMKRRIDKLENMVTLRSTASSVNLASSSEKAVVAAPVASARPAASPSPPPDGCGPRIEVFKIGDSHRNSEDWRRFFGHAKIETPTAPS